MGTSRHLGQRSHRYKKSVESKERKRQMKREDAKANLIALGVAEPTEEQITNYLNQLEGETNGLKTKLSKAEKDAQNVADLQKQLKALEDAKLTDEEKAEKLAKEKDDLVAQLQGEVKSMQLRSQLAEKGITGDDADKLIASFNGGSLDVELLGNIISNRETEAAKKKEQEIAKQSTNPGGGTAGGTGGDSDKGYDENAVNSVISSMVGSGEKSTTEIIGNYL